MAEAICRASLRWGVEVFVEISRPYSKFRVPSGVDQEESSILSTFTGLHLRCFLNIRKAQPLYQRIDDAVSNPQWPPAHVQFPKLPAIHVPGDLEFLTVFPGYLGKKIETGEFLLQLESDKWLRKRRAVEDAVVKLAQAALAPSGTIISSPTWMISGSDSLMRFLRSSARLL